MKQASIKNQQFFAVPCYLRSMTRAASFAGVILAAGESSRMGGEKPAALAPASGRTSDSNETFLSAAIRSLLLATDFVVVVVGQE